MAAFCRGARAKVHFDAVRCFIEEGDVRGIAGRLKSAPRFRD